MKPALWITIVSAAVLSSSASAAHSQLWGERGENWTPQSRLPDFSFAGYHCGEVPPPTVPPGVSVKDFGARGDGIADDTAAFIAALAKVERGAIEVPAGRYRITGILEITRPGLVLRGVSPEKSVLFFPKPLQEIRPNTGATTTGRPTSNYSWSGGFVWLRGNFRSKPLTRITGAAQRGDQAVAVESIARLRAGQRVEITVRDTAQDSLAAHLYSDDPGSTKQLKGNTRASLVVRVVAIEGNRVRFDRPLRFDIRPEWQPQILSFDPTVSEVGVENLGFEFPVTDYQGHFTELGFNPLAMTAVTDCWARHLRIVNADSGPMISGSFNTLEDVIYESARKPDKAGCVGHHGIYLGGADNHFTGFDIRCRFIHDLSVSHCSGNVCSHGRGQDLCLDHHKRAPFENLFTDLDAGAGTRLWHCGGGDALGKNCGARGTFWNIRSRAPLKYPPAAFGPASMNLVGLTTDQPNAVAPDGKWFETIPPSELAPQNLHQAQLARRLKVSGSR